MAARYNSASVLLQGFPSIVGPYQTKQTSFASLAYQVKKKHMHLERFLAFEMDRVVTWKQLLAVIQPHYLKAGKRGPQQMPLGSMLRIYIMQPWCAMSDSGVEDAFYGIGSMHRFIGLELSEDCDSRRDDDSGVSSLAGAT